MSDQTLRELERLAASGDLEAEKKLYAARCRYGNCCLHAAGLARYAGSHMYLLFKPGGNMNGGLICCWCGRETHLATEKHPYHGPNAPAGVGGDEISRGGYHIP
jgi:hypothetical protein